MSVNAVNKQTGGLLPLAGTQAYQYTTVPPANIDNLNKIIQYVGTTTSSYINGYFYKCVLDGSTYEWQNVQVSEDSSVIDGSTVTPTDDIATWLACAGLHQSYTTLSDVLADEAVLSALMASTNAVDYLVRSTTWATTICANQTAMNCIGVNDYCADILLDNSTWRTAICNSTYFEEVLNVKVPTMTSNTTPYGIVTCNSELSGYEGYKVFGEDYQTTRWVSQVQTNGYVQYEFIQDVSIKLIKLRVNLTGNDQYRRCKDFKIQVGNDATDLYSNTAALSSSIQTFIIPNPNKYKKYRFLVLNTDSDTIAVDDLQFYGRGKSPVVDTKADISAIATEEAGATSSRDYAIGEHFYKNGKFCIAIASIASGATFTLNTNYVEGTIADSILDIYSASEICIGSWFGSPLYRKCFDIDNTISSNGTYTLASGITSNNIVDIHGVGFIANTGQNDTCTMLPFISRSNINAQLGVQVDYAGNIFIYNGSSGLTFHKFRIVIEYIK